MIRCGQRQTPLSAGVYEGWHQWQRVQHGPGCADALASELARLGVRRPFLVTTQSLVREHTLLARIRDSVGMQLAGEFSRTAAHTPRQTVLAGASEARRSGADGILAFGGGTVVDTAKGIALAIAADIHAHEDFDRVLHARHEASAFGDVLLPLLALPTTLSGAEFSGIIGITDESSRKKDLFRFDRVTPRSILLDPGLTAATPPRLWSATGIKVMSDAIEQVYSLRPHPIVDALSLEAIRSLAAFLPASVHGDGDVRSAARLHCQLATWMVLFGSQNANAGVALGGALRHQLGGMFGIAHGELTCALLPRVLRFNSEAIPDGYRRLADALASDERHSTTGGCLESVVGRISDLIRVLDLPDRLEPLGVDPRKFPQVAAHVLEESAVQWNPRPVRNAGEIVDLLASAM